MNRAILNTVAPPLKQITRLVCSPINIQRLKHIEAQNDAEAAKLAKAILAASEGMVEDEDRSWINAIEDVRADWLQNESQFIQDNNQHNAARYDLNQTVREIALASKDARRAKVLYQLIIYFQPACAIELGTNLGVSSAYQALAMRHHHNTPELHVFDLSLARLQMAEKLHKKLPVAFITAHHGDFEHTLAPALDELPPLDYAFVDGHHQYIPSKTYTDLICKHANRGAIIVFDDIRWNAGMRRFWKEIKSDVRFSHIIDLFTFGVAIFAGSSHNAPPKNEGPFFIFF